MKKTNNCPPTSFLLKPEKLGAPQPSDNHKNLVPRKDRYFYLKNSKFEQKNDKKLRNTPPLVSSS
ncbi:MAG: hypothetical protein IKY57_05255, partial [Alistipes sp.]|nr:hypothetical protein [Alistipes sp.]